MYLVEIETGREELYNSVDALVAAIRGGVVGPRSRIYHRASSSWVSIVVHPEYRKVIAAQAAEPLPPLRRKQWTFYGVEPKGREIEEPAEAAAAPAVAQPGESRRSWRARLGNALRGLTPAPRRSEASES